MAQDKRSCGIIAATNLLQKLPDEPSLSSWMVILRSCQLHGNVDVAKEAIEFIIKLVQKKETTNSFAGFFVEVDYASY